MDDDAPKQWFYGTPDDRHGPHPASALIELVTAGTILPQTLVWSEGMPAWLPSASLPFLKVARPVGPPVRDDGGALNLLLPMAPQSGFAIAAGYLGLLSFIPLLAPLAILFGVLGLSALKKHPHKRGMGRAVTGIVLGSLSIVITVLVLVLRRR
jgi:hypothetical protein